MSPTVKAALVAFALTAAWCLAVPGPRAEGLAGPAAGLRLQVRIDAGLIKVGDLWSDAGPKADAVVGPAPQPGRLIAVEAGQLAYIARLYEVRWRPTSGVERSLIERSGRPLTREEMGEPLKRALAEAGAAASVTIEIPNVEPMLVPPMSIPLVSVEAVSYDPASDRFAASIAVSADGMQTLRSRVSGRLTRTVAAVVASRRLQTGDAIGADDVRVSQYPERRLAAPAVSDIYSVLGQAAKRTVVAGQPLSQADFGPPTLVTKGATVVVSVESPGISLAAQGIALGAGGRDDVVQVMNPLSRSVVAARVIGPGRASINPSSVPLVAPVLSGPPRPSEVSQ
jgi:flagella basal body P-ring formation protein FlgA